MASGVRLLVAGLRAGSLDLRFGTEHIILGIRSAHISGSLVFGDDDAPRAVLVFENGHVRKARSTLAAYLGGVLYELGRIDQPTLDSSLAAVAIARTLHGEVLREQEKITEQDLELGLREQIERRIADVVTLPQGTKWKFHENEDRLEGFGGSDWPLVDPIGGLWRGLRDGARQSLVQATLARASDYFFVLSSAFTPEQLGFDRAELAIARSFATPRRLVERGERGDVSKVEANLRHLLIVSGALLISEEPATPRTSSGTMQAVAATPEPQVEESPVPSAPRNLVSPLQAVELVRALLASGKQAQARATAMVAIERFEHSIQLRVELAWVEANGEGCDMPARIDMNIECFDELAKEYASCADVYYYRGLLHRRQGMASFACRDLRLALQFDPKHLAASRDLRLFNSRREKGMSVEDAIGIVNQPVKDKRVG